MNWGGPLEGFKPTTLILSGRATSVPEGRGAYTVRLTIEQDIFSKPFEYLFSSDSSVGGDAISPRTLQDGAFNISIARLVIPSTIRGRINATVVSTADNNVRASRSLDFQVPVSSESWRHCIVPLIGAVSQVFDVPLAGEAGLAVTAAMWKAYDRTNVCGGNQVCLANEMLNMVDELDKAKWDTMANQVARIHPALRAAYLIKYAAENATDIIKCGQWITDLTVELAKQGIKRGKQFFELITGSPVYPLVINRSGQRAGFLPNGQVVVEISGAQVYAIGDKRHVIYPGEDALEVHIAGYAQGTMSVHTLSAQSGGVIAEYRNVEVSPGMQATINVAEDSPAMKVDTNGDGQPEKTLSPNSLERLSGVTPPPGGASYSFPQTGFAVSGRFWEMWQGGRSFDDSLYINGFPITSLRPEISTTDGKSYQTQWFERARYEQHPENQAPHDVLLGLLGTNAAKGRQGEAAFKPVGNPGGDLAWFRETQHTLGDTSEGGRAIAAYWNRLGGLPQFGFPLSQPFMERNAGDGKTYLVQYFERQRFEYHPEHKGSRYEVLLGRLGAEQLGNITLVHTLSPGAGNVVGLEFSPDGQTLACATDFSIVLGRVTDGTLLPKIPGLNGRRAVAFSPNGRILATAWYGEVRLTEVSDGKTLRVLTVQQPPFRTFISLAFAQNGQILIAGSNEGSVMIWRVEDGTLLRTIDSHNFAVPSVAASPNGEIIASASADKTIRLWKVLDGSLVRVIAGHTDQVHSIVFSPDGGSIISGSGDKSIKVWRMADGAMIRSMEGHTDAVSSIDISPDGQHLVSGSWDKTMGLWRLSDGRLLQRIEAHSDDVLSVAFSPNGRIIASGSADDTTRLWRLP
jgi:WD40 repeat protein